MDLSVSGEILTYFHMIYEECTTYVTKHPGLPYYEGLRVVLLTLWHMFSELEQMHYLVSTGAVTLKERTELRMFIADIRKNLYPQPDGRGLAHLRKHLHYQEPEVNYVLNKYLLRAELLGRYKKCMMPE